MSAPNPACQTCGGTGRIGVKYPGDYGGDFGAEYDWQPCPDCDLACEYCGELNADHSPTERLSCDAEIASEEGAAIRLANADAEHHCDDPINCAYCSERRAEDEFEAERHS